MQRAYLFSASDCREDCTGKRLAFWCANTLSGECYRVSRIIVLSMFENGPMFDIVNLNPACQSSPAIYPHFNWWEHLYVIYNNTKVKKHMQNRIYCAFQNHFLHWFSICVFDYVQLFGKKLSIQGHFRLARFWKRDFPKILKTVKKNITN